MSKPIPKFLRLVSVATLLATPFVLLARTPTQEEFQKLPANQDAANVQFGRSVAMAGDTVVIGAWFDDGGSGSAHVYTRGASRVWSEQAKLGASDGAAWDNFGVSVALSDDTALVGAYLDDDNGESSGSAYVYIRDASGVWKEQAKLLASDGAAGDSFGGSVALSGDSAVIGARNDDDGRGSAYVYTRNATGRWLEQAKLLTSDAAFNFGKAVAISADTAVIGATGHYSEAAYLYTRDAGGNWFEEAKLRPSDNIGGNFGSSVAITTGTVVIGADSDPANGLQSGSAYVYTHDANGIWAEQAKLLAVNGAARDFFGHSVSVSGDTAVIGAPGVGTGSAYVYTLGSNGVWTERAKLLASDLVRDESTIQGFGQSVSVSGDTAVIGAPYVVPGPGAAYVYQLDLVSATLHCPGDINGDGLPELVAVTEMGDVRVKDLDGAEINSFQLSGMTGVVDTELMPDTNTNGAPELVALGAGNVGAQVRDVITGAALSSVDLGPNTSPVDLEILPDRTGNGIPELARLSYSPVTVEVRDGLTAQTINSVPFANYEAPQELEIYPDATGNGWPELAVLGDHRFGGSDKVEIRDPETGAVVRNIWLGRDWRPREQALLADMSGNGSKEVALLREHETLHRVNVWIRDTTTAEWVNFIGFNPDYLPQKLLPIPDINGNGADELVVFGRRFDGSNQKAVIKDSKSGKKLGQLWFDKNFPGKDLVNCGDINGNGSADLALLGRRLSDGRLKVIVKDSRTGERLALVWFD